MSRNRSKDKYLFSINLNNQQIVIITCRHPPLPHWVDPLVCAIIMQILDFDACIGDFGHYRGTGTRQLLIRMLPNQTDLAVKSAYTNGLT